nr:pentatricopeptide repeat-containing protein, mitochondrial [Quercus suber]
MVRKNLTPNKRTYAVLVNAWCSIGRLREVQDFLKEMSRKGLNPPVRDRDLLMEGLLNAGHLEAAKDMARKMAKQGFVRRRRGVKVKPVRRRHKEDESGWLWACGRVCERAER